MTTSPCAWSSPATRSNTIEPVRPVASLSYVPSQCPASAATFEAVPSTGTGAEVVAQPIARTARERIDPSPWIRFICGLPVRSYAPRASRLRPGRRGAGVPRRGPYNPDAFSRIGQDVPRAFNGGFTDPVPGSRLRSLPDRRPARPRGDGRGLPGARHAARPRGRAEGAPGGGLRRRGPPRAFRAGGAGRFVPEPPEHRRRLRGGRAPRAGPGAAPALPRDGAHRRRADRRLPRGRADAAAPVPRPRHAARRRHRARARVRDRPPRPEALQRLRDVGRARDRKSV